MELKLSKKKFDSLCSILDRFDISINYNLIKDFDLNISYYKIFIHNFSYYRSYYESHYSSYMDCKVEDDLIIFDVGEFCDKIEETNLVKIGFYGDYFKIEPCIKLNIKEDIK